MKNKIITLSVLFILICSTALAYGGIIPITRTMENGDKYIHLNLHSEKYIETPTELSPLYKLNIRMDNKQGRDKFVDIFDTSDKINKESCKNVPKVLYSYHFEHSLSNNEINYIGGELALPDDKEYFVYSQGRDCEKLDLRLFKNIAGKDYYRFKLTELNDLLITEKSDSVVVNSIQKSKSVKIDLPDKGCKKINNYQLCSDGSVYNTKYYKIFDVSYILSGLSSNNPAIKKNSELWAATLS